MSNERIEKPKTKVKKNKWQTNLVCPKYFVILLLEFIWYLSSNGHDRITCGQNILNACRTLDWLLHRFYNTCYNMSKTLCMVTDISLVVDDTLVVSFYHSGYFSEIDTI